MEEHVEHKGWFRRNWLWAVPVGGCLTLILLLVFGVGAAIFGVTKALSGSQPYKDAIYKASQNSEIIELLGEPIESDGMMNGSISVENDNGTANISVPIKGPKNKAKVFVVGEKVDGQWYYSEMYVKHAIGENIGREINLLE